MPHGQKLRIIAAYVTLCVVWSSTWLVIKVGLDDLPPVSFAALRFLLAFLVLVAFSVGRAAFWPKSSADWKLLAWTGVLMFSFNYGLLFWGEKYISSGLAAVLQAMIVIFGMFFAHFMIPSEPLSWRRVFGAILAGGGVALICGRLMDHGGMLAFWGGLGVVMGGAAAAFSNVSLKRRALKLAPAMIAGWQMLFGTVPLLLLGLVTEGNPLEFSLEPDGDFLPALSRGHRLGADLSPALLAPAAHPGEQFAKHLADHAAGRGRDRLAVGRRDVFPLVAGGRRARAGGRVDDFSPRDADRGAAGMRSPLCVARRDWLNPRRAAGP